MAESDEALQLKRRARRRLVGAIALVTFAVVMLPLVLDREPGPAGPPLNVQIPSQDSGRFNTPVAPTAPPAAEKSGDIPAAEAEALAARAEASAAQAEAPTTKTETASAKAELPQTKADAATPKMEPPTTKVAAKAETKAGVKAESKAETKAETKAENKAETTAAAALARPIDKDEEGPAPSAVADKTWSVSLDAFSSEKNVKQLRAKLTAAGVKSYTESVKTGKGELTRVRAGPFPNKEAAEKARAKLVAMGLKPAAVVSR